MLLEASVSHSRHSLGAARSKQPPPADQRSLAPRPKRGERAEPMGATQQQVGPNPAARRSDTYANTLPFTPLHRLYFS